MTPAERRDERFRARFYRAIVRLAVERKPEPRHRAGYLSVAEVAAPSRAMQVEGRGEDGEEDGPSTDLANRATFSLTL